jgi:TRAP-type mannitol/chloroaromatic compound transport system permease small subunit
LEDARPVSHEKPALGRGGPGKGGAMLLTLCRALAIVGGLVFVGLVGMELVSIVGRKLFAWTVPGDVEVLQMCAAFASASFFAYCHMVNGDVKVDFFTHNLAPPNVALLDAVGSFLVGAFGAVITWRTAASAWSLEEVGETSAILGFPVWIAQALMIPGFALLAVAGFFMAARLLRAAVLARERRRHPT